MTNPNSLSYLKLSFILPLIGASLLIHGTLRAQIESITLTNSSATDSLAVGPSPFVSEFSSSLTGTAPTLVGLQTASFTTRLSSYNGYSSPGTAAQTQKRNIIYQVDFTVLDSGSVGYELQIDSTLRGYTTVSYSGDESGATNGTALDLVGSIDTDTSDANDTLGDIVSDLTLFGNDTSANFNSNASNVVTDISDSYAAGTFTGTRSFSLYFTSVTAPGNNVIVSNFDLGQGSIRFGELAAEALSTSGAQAGDAFAASELGHFLTVEVDYLAPIPEPAHFAFGLGGVFLASALVRRRRRSN